MIKILSFCQIIIYLRLITTQVNPLILSSNAKCQWVNCSRIESHKSSWEQQMIKQFVALGYCHSIDKREKTTLCLLPLARLGFVIRFLLAFLHVLTIVIDRHRFKILIREHEVDAFQFHHDLFIVAEIGMNIVVDILLLLENGIVSGNEEQESNANQPDRPSKSHEEPAHMVVEIDSQTTVPRVQIQRFQQYMTFHVLELWSFQRIEFCTTKQLA